MADTAFQRALRGLAHPPVIAAILLLLVNDHWLRWNHPSWWTGKIGDAAWLFFASFALAMLLARCLPGRDRLAGARSVGLVGLVLGW